MSSPRIPEKKTSFVQPLPAEVAPAVRANSVDEHRAYQTNQFAAAIENFHVAVDEAAGALEVEKANKTPQSALALLNPLTAAKTIAGHYQNIQTIHDAQLEELRELSHGAKMAAVVARKHNIPPSWMRAGDVQDLAVLAGGLDNALAIKNALAKLDSFGLDTSYLTTEMDELSVWTGEKVRVAHETSETSRAILDNLSTANNFAKEKLDVAMKYYRDPARSDSLPAKTGLVATWTGDLLASVFTMPATIVDPHAGDEERSQAITGTMLMLGTMGLLKGVKIPPGMTKTVDDALGQLLAKAPLAQLQKMSQKQLADDIYKKIYNPAGAPKPATITQEVYAAKIKTYKNSFSDGYWHRRFGEAGNVDAGDIQRFYFNVKPDHAPELAEILTKKLNEAGLKFQYKMPEKLSKFDRSDAAVLYVEKGQAEAVQKIISRHADTNPSHFAKGSPAFTEPVRKGIARADEPLPLRQPPGELQHSFGTSRSSIIAEAIKKAPSSATPAELRALVRERFKHYGIDPDKPWLNPGS
jgi:hypothetical protein